MSFIRPSDSLILRFKLFCWADFRTKKYFCVDEILIHDHSFELGEFCFYLLLFAYDMHIVCAKFDTKKKQFLSVLVMVIY